MFSASVQAGPSKSRKKSDKSNKGRKFLVQGAERDGADAASVSMVSRLEDASTWDVFGGRNSTTGGVVTELIRTSPMKDKYERLEAFQPDSPKTERVDFTFYVMEVRDMFWGI